MSQRHSLTDLHVRQGEARELVNRRMQIRPPSFPPTIHVNKTYHISLAFDLLFHTIVGSPFPCRRMQRDDYETQEEQSIKRRAVKRRFLDSIA